MKKYFILAAAALTLAACSTDENENTVQNDNVIRLSSSFTAQTRAGNDIYGNGTHFAANTTVKVQVTDNAASNKVTYAAVDYTDDGTGKLTGSSTQYYPASGSNVDIYAYYPSTASTESNGFAVSTDQSSDANYKSSDLMYASITGINKNSNDAARTLTFNHLLSKIVVTLVKGDGMTDAEINAATVTLKGVIIKGTFTPANGSFSAAADAEGNKGDITIATNAGTTAHAAIVVPQSVADKTLEIKIGNSTQTYTFTSGISFAAAQHNDYTLTLNKTGITNVTATIGNWGEGSSDSKTLTF